MTLRQILNKLNYTFVGFWDKCFFSQNTRDSGFIVIDNNTGEMKYISYFELNKIAKGK